MEIVGNSLFDLCDTTNKVAADCSTTWASLFFMEKDCENAEEALDVFQGTILNSAPCLWIDYDEIVDDDKRWVMVDGKPRLSIDSNA